MNITPPLSTAYTVGMTDDQFSTFKQEGCSLCHKTDVTESRLKRSVCKADVTQTLCNHPFHKNCLIKHFSKCMSFRELSPVCPTCQCTNPVSEEDRLLLESTLVKDTAYTPGELSVKQILEEHKDSLWVPAIQNACLRMKFETGYDTGHSRFWLETGATITDEELSELLRRSIEENRLRDVKELFDTGAKLESEELRALAEKASDKNHLGLLKFLVLKGVPLSADKINQHFREAIKNNDRPWAETLKNLNAKLPSEELNSYCIDAAKKQRMEMVFLLMDCGAKPTAEDWSSVFKEFPDEYHSTADYKQLKKMGIKPDTEHCNTRFRQAVNAWDHNCAKDWKLLGADLGTEELNAMVRKAAEKNKHFMVSTLLKLGAKPDKEEFRKLLNQAIAKRHSRLALTLIKNGAEATKEVINACFIIAVKGNDDCLAREWKNYKVDLSSAELNGLLNTITRSLHYKEFAKILMESGAKPDVNTCNSFFRQAAYRNDPSEAKIWLDRGARPATRDFGGLCYFYNPGRAINTPAEQEKAEAWKQLFKTNETVLGQSLAQAVEHNAPKLVQTFLTLGLKPDPDCIRSGFSRAATAGDVLAAKKWKSAGKKVDVKFTKEERNTGFWAAVENRDFDSARKWIKYIDASPRPCDLNERLSRAQAENDTDMITKLQLFGAQPVTP